MSTEVERGRCRIARWRETFRVTHRLPNQRRIAVSRAVAGILTTVVLIQNGNAESLTEFSLRKVGQFSEAELVVFVLVGTIVNVLDDRLSGMNEILDRLKGGLFRWLGELFW